LLLLLLLLLLLFLLLLLLGVVGVGYGPGRFEQGVHRVAEKHRGSAQQDPPALRVPA